MENINCDKEFINWIVEHQILPLDRHMSTDFAEEVLMQGFHELQVRKTRGVGPIFANDRCTLTQIKNFNASLMEMKEMLGQIVLTSSNMQH